MGRSIGPMAGVVAVVAGLALAAAAPAHGADARRCGQFVDRTGSGDGYLITVTSRGVRCRAAMGIARDLRFGRGVDVRGEDDIHLERWPGWRCGEGSGGGNCTKGRRSVGWQVGLAPPRPRELRFPPQLYNGDIDLRIWEQSSTNGPQVEPAHIKFGSGSGWTISKWRSWGARVAVGTGVYHDHGFETTGTVRLRNPRRCGRFRLYTVLTARYDERMPGPYQPPQRISLARSCY